MLSNQPLPGQTWLSRDGSVAQVFAATDNHADIWPLLVEYSDGAEECMCEHGYYDTDAEYAEDLTHQSPWNKIREEILCPTEKDSALIQNLWDGACDALFPLCTVHVGGGDMAQVDSEVLEFISWAELRGLTPENLAEMRGKVAA